MNYFEILKLAMPETILSLAALIVLFVDLGFMRLAEGKFRRMIAASSLAVPGFTRKVAMPRSFVLAVASETT